MVPVLQTNHQVESLRAKCPPSSETANTKRSDLECSLLTLFNLPPVYFRSVDMRKRVSKQMVVVFFARAARVSLRATCLANAAAQPVEVSQKQTLSHPIFPAAQQKRGYAVLRFRLVSPVTFPVTRLLRDG
ncbi:hypothetical protein BaRGS_00006352 [Batillaria attramentaria]|uniref:Uncharacterized protein n=1 Tax=Batillaria attramentaria TaxID=370345 RepID=A0ABD0LS37_9CAEN